MMTTVMNEQEVLATNDPKICFEYARDVKKDRWREAEEVIKQNPEIMQQYLHDVVMGNGITFFDCSNDNENYFENWGMDCGIGDEQEALWEKISNNYFSPWCKNPHILKQLTFQQLYELAKKNRNLWPIIEKIVLERYQFLKDLSESHQRDDGGIPADQDMFCSEWQEFCSLFEDKRWQKAEQYIVLTNDSGWYADEATMTVREREQFLETALCVTLKNLRSTAKHKDIMDKYDYKYELNLRFENLLQILKVMKSKNCFLENGGQINYRFKSFLLQGYNAVLSLNLSEIAFEYDRFVKESKYIHAQDRKLIGLIPWQQLEQIIMQDPKCILSYVVECIKGRWEAAEPVILQSEYAQLYLDYISGQKIEFQPSRYCEKASYQMI